MQFHPAMLVKFVFFLAEKNKNKVVFNRFYADFENGLVKI